MLIEARFVLNAVDHPKNNSLCSDSSTQQISQIFLTIKVVV